jgi:hypothetical protein
LYIYMIGYQNNNYIIYYQIKFGHLKLVAL